MNKLIKFIKESFAELKKVIWPSPEEVSSSTRVVIVSVFLIAIALGLVDILLYRVIDWLFNIN